VDTALELVVRAAFIFPLRESQILWWIGSMRDFTKMTLDMFDALNLTLQNIIAETAYIVKKFHNSEFPSHLQPRNFQIGATMFAFKACCEVIRPRNWVGTTDFLDTLVGRPAYPYLIKKMDSLDMLRHPFCCKRSAAIWTWIFD
jgi:hypothetical protein